MEMEQVYNEAMAAATAAQTLALAPYGGKEPNHGSCGFAWVIVKPARGPFVAWCKEQIEKHKKANGRAWHGYGDNAYGGGWQFWKPGNFNGQLIDIHEAGAKAFAEVLKKHGLNATWSSRLD